MSELKSQSATLRGEAQDILRGQGNFSPEDLLQRAKDLKSLNEFGYGRRLLARAREQKISDRVLRIKLCQQHALCTYKDPDLPAFQKLVDAEEILNSVDELKETRDLETLGMAGAIWKRMWQVDANKKSLEKSFHYYSRGHYLNLESDDGYTGINTAYVLDQLAWIEEQEALETGATSEIARSRREEALKIREQVLEILLKVAAREKDAAIERGEEWKEEEAWWFLVTGGEACFGLKRFEEARKWLIPARELRKADRVRPWEFETTAVQLATLARINPEEGTSGSPLESTEAWKILNEFLDNQADAVQTLFSGKFGLGLSGGGFRASFYHIGVLARLAELDLLRHVHVISCVSGGSIVGAHYYLELRKLLKDKYDSQADEQAPQETINRMDYVHIVERVADAFLKGVERNIRTRIVGNLFENIKMAFSSTYSRTMRAGELYESEIYSQVDDGEGPERFISDLFVFPKGKSGFNPKYDNWMRRNKVPILVLNATTLNTGHNWQFTASWMGESPFSINEAIDGNWRYRRMWYGEAPEQYQNVRLGTAVGASACVPGLLEPITFPELYPKEDSDYPEMTVRLVDGGVHDNQGIASLLEQDCSILLVSDASGQMTSDPNPKGGVFAPLLRMNSALMERVRQAQLIDLAARKRASLLKNLVVLHLKKGLNVDPVSWKRCKEPPDVPLRRREELLDYGILRNVQQSLANLRTDLDSFSEVEAYSLMASGYLMCDCYAPEITALPQEVQEERHSWNFLSVEEALKGNAPSEKQQDEFEKMLEIGSKGAFKIWRLLPFLTVLAFVLGAGALAGFIWAWVSNPDLLLLRFTLNDLGWLALWTVIGLVVSSGLMKLVRYKNTLRDFIKYLVGSVVLFLAAQIHLRIFDPLFLRKGRANRISNRR